MESQKIYTDHAGLNLELGKLRRAASTLQPFVDKFNSLEGFPELLTDQFSELMKTPKEFIINVITKGEGLPKHFGFSSEKVFELMDKPEGTDQLITDIANFLHMPSAYSIFNHLYALQIRDGKLIVAEPIIRNLEISHSVYLTNDVILAAYEQLNSVVENLNTLSRKKTVNPKTLIGDVITHENGSFAPNYGFLMGLK